MYTKYRETRILPEMGNVGYTDWTLPEPTADYYTDEIMQEAEEFSDTAVVVLGRSGGEGQDLPTDMNAVINGTYDIRDEVADGNEQYNYFNCNYDNNGTITILMRASIIWNCQIRRKQCWILYAAHLTM